MENTEMDTFEEVVHIYDNGYLMIRRRDLRHKLMFIFASYTLFLGILYCLCGLIFACQHQELLADGSIRTGAVFVFIGSWGVDRCKDTWGFRPLSIRIRVDRWEQAQLHPPILVGIFAIYGALFGVAQWMCFPQSREDVPRIFCFSGFVGIVCFCISHKQVKYLIS